MGLFDIGAVQSVPGFFRLSHDKFEKLAATACRIPSPSDEGIQPTPGDDLSAPNAVKMSQMNQVVTVCSANVGFSNAAQDKRFPPSGVEYRASVEEVEDGNIAMTLKILLEYTSPFPKEGMMVWIKKHQQVISDELDSELVLIDTVFEDFVDGEWISISTMVRYTEEADSIVHAVVSTDCGQTAGRLKTEGTFEDAKLGPVGERGRIVLTYRCERLYSYSEMSLGGTMSARLLVPIGFHLPWTALDNPAGNCRVRVAISAPEGTTLLDPASNILAYRDLQRSFSRKEQAVVLPEPESSTASAWDFKRPNLPVMPTMVLTWLSIPDPSEGFEFEGESIAAPARSVATLMKASGDDARCMSPCAPPGAETHLLRCRVQTQAPNRESGSVRMHTDITISDASGSTGMRTSPDGRTVRHCFNKFEEARLLKRLEAIPKLRSVGVLLESDLWGQLFVWFDDGIRHEFAIMSTVKDLDEATVGLLLCILNITSAFGSTDAAAAAADATLRQSGKGRLLDDWKALLAAIRSAAPGGTTSFSAGAKRAKQRYAEMVAKVRNSITASTSYVNFDTDGGNNHPSCYEAVSDFVAAADVVQGHVLGIGSWVDQDCATRVARLLKGSASLSLTFPEEFQADQEFRRDLSRWIKSLRAMPVTVKVSAGSKMLPARHGQRLENGVDCLFACGEGLSFAPPDVTDPTFSKAVLKGLMAGEAVTFYILSRYSIDHLLSAFKVEIDGIPADVTSGSERLKNLALGHHWLSALGLKDCRLTANSSVLCTRLRQRLEDDISFAWNLPSKSGSTAAMGRAATKQRPPIPKERQPDEPTIVVAPSYRWFPESPNRTCGYSQQVSFGFSDACSSAGGLFGSSSAGGLFGSAGGGGLFGASHSSSAGGLFGRTGGGRGSAGGGGLFGATSGGGGNMFAGSTVPQKQGPLKPSTLLSQSQFLGIGAPESSVQHSIQRAVTALSYCAKSAIGPPTNDANQGVPIDPLVGLLLGVAATGPVQSHHGFTCDVSNVSPILGTRWKATNELDFDITDGCRQAGRYPTNGAGFVPIPDPQSYLREALARVFEWWPFFWADQCNLFQVRPDLLLCDIRQLAGAVEKLPGSSISVDF